MGARKKPKKNGGKVFVSITHDGEATFHEGYLSVKEARKRKAAGQPAEQDSRPARAERTAAMDNYLGLQRHAAVRVELLSHPAMALRLAVAHMIAGSALWQVKPEGQRASTPEIKAEVAASKAQGAFGEERKAVLALLGIEDGGPLVDQSFGSPHSLGELFAALMEKEDAAILRILAYAMAETLEAHHGIVDTLGGLFSTDMRNWWTPGETFFGLLRDKLAINAMVREVAGDITADANITAPAKVQKKIVIDCLNGTREAKAKDWLPRYMAFPAQDYTDRAA